MGKITVLHLMPSSSFSGAEKVTCQIMEMFKDNTNFKMVMVCGNGSIKTQLEQRGIEYYLLDSFNLKKIEKIVKEVAPDIIHAHDYSASMMATYLKGVPVLAHLHNNALWLRKINAKSLAFATCIRKLSKVYGVSESVKDEYLFKSYYKDKFEVLPNVLDYEEILSKAKQFVSKKEIDIVFVGRLTFQKNPLKFLEIIRTVKEKYPEIKVLMLGTGELETECRRYILENDLTANVEMKGFVENPYPYMEKAKLMVLPSEFEGFGLVAVEALMLETPVLCSNVGGLGKIVDDTCGKICCTVSEYVTEIERMLEDQEYYKKKRSACKEKAMLFSDMNKYKEKLEKTYKEILEERRS